MFRYGNNICCLLFCIAVLFPSRSMAQPPPLTARLIISPVLSSFISEWERDPNQIRLSLVNIVQNNLDVTFEVTLRGRRSGLSIISIGKRLSIRPGPQVLFPKDIFDFKAINIDTEAGKSVRISRRLPDDNWELCVKMTVQSTNQIVTTCADFMLQFAVPPTLINPQNGERITTRFPLFQWNAAAMKPGIRVLYRLNIYDLLPGQNARQALESNPAHFKQDDITVTSLIYPVAALPFKNKSQYIWQVQAYDEYGNPLGDNEGKSEIWSFTYEEIR